MRPITSGTCSMSNMTELGLRTSVGRAATTAAPPDAPAMVADVSMLRRPTIELAEPGTPPADQRGEFLLTFLDKLMDVLAQLAPDSDGQLEGFREHPGLSPDARTSRVSGLPIIAGTASQPAAAIWKVPRPTAANEKELAEVISILGSRR